jgi:hypothetical protein
MLQSPHRLKSPKRRICEQIRALIVKTALVQSRRPSSMLMFLMAPSLFIILLSVVQTAVQKASENGDIQLGISKCSSFSVYGQMDSSIPCITIAFAVNSPNGTTGR